MLINEIARMVGMSKDGVRHYEQLGLITSSPRQAGSRIYRDYDLSVLKVIEDIRGLQNLGLSLNEIEPILKTIAAGYTEKELVLFLEERLLVVRKKIADLNVIEQHLSKKLLTYTTKCKSTKGRTRIRHKS